MEDILSTQEFGILRAHTYELAPFYPFTADSIVSVVSDVSACWRVCFPCFLFDEWFLGNLRGLLEILLTLFKYKSWMKRTSYILVNGEKSLFKSIIQRCLLVFS